MTVLLTSEQVARLTQLSVEEVESWAANEPPVDTCQPGEAPGHMAVALLDDGRLPDGSPGVRVLYIGHGPDVHTTLVSERQARRLLDLTIQRLDFDVRWGTEPTRMRRLQGGAWSCRWRCPDGVVRRFVVKADAKPASRKPLAPTLRWSILERDGFTCRYCGATAPTVELAVDHVVSVIDGGSDESSNLVTACVGCNSGKGRRSLRGAA